MIREELESLIAEVQQRQSELSDVEVKSSRGGTPKRLYESLSAFANRTGGGAILFGLDENTDFEVVGVGNPQQLQADIGNLAASEMEPALRPEFTVEEIDEKTVVAVEHLRAPSETLELIILKRDVTQLHIKSCQLASLFGQGAGAVGLHQRAAAVLGCGIDKLRDACFELPVGRQIEVS